MSYAILKTIASAGFVALALKRGCGGWILAALVLSFFGDVLLISKKQRMFLAGIGAFLLAHLAFAAAFVLRGVRVEVAAVALLVASVIGYVVHRWLAPRVPSKLRVPVVAYIVTIVMMVSLSYATQWTWIVPLAATAFFVSDLAVARERFVHATPWNRAWGLPLYYLAQYLFASVC